MGFFDNLGSKITQGISWLGSKIADGASWLGQKLVPVVNTIAKGVGYVAPTIAGIADIFSPSIGNIIRRVGTGADYVADKTGEGGIVKNTLERIKSTADVVTAGGRNLQQKMR